MMLLQKTDNFTKGRKDYGKVWQAQIDKFARKDLSEDKVRKALEEKLDHKELFY